MKLQYHPDGFIYLRDGFTEVYGDTVDNFQQDYGLTLPPMPAGMFSYTYDSDAKILVYYDEFGNAFPVEGQADAPELHNACSGCSTILANQTARIAAAQPATTTTTAIG